MKKKTIVLGITGGIAVFKAAQLTSNLIKKGYDVEVIMTKNATEFMTPLTFESLTGHNVMVDTFEKVADRSVKHISIAKRADVFVVVPATANIIAKMVHGLADDMLSTTFLAASCPKIVCPAMNTGMYTNPITQRNIALLKQYQIEVIDPSAGFLACGDQGLGRLAELSTIEDAIEMALIQPKPLLGKKVCISAGPTQEALDPVRFMTNHSSGKMGYALARYAKALGADVSVVHGPVSERLPYGVKDIKVTTAQEMFEVFKQHYQQYDFIIKTAAVGDYRFHECATQKIKKADATISCQLIKNPDILEWLGNHKLPHQVLCGFAMETQNLIAYAEEKRQKKHCDILIANSLTQKDAGFQSDTNIVTILQENTQEALPCMTKQEVSIEIWKRLIKIAEEKGVLKC